MFFRVSNALYKIFLQKITIWLVINQHLSFGQASLATKIFILNKFGKVKHNLFVDKSSLELNLGMVVKMYDTVQCFIFET
jgi:hypothetical protein